MNRDTKRRFSFIEICLHWGNGITARQLGETFEIARQNAQATINAYRELHPNNMQYNPSRKCHEASSQFKTHYIKDKPEFYLDYLRGNHLTSRFWEDENWGDLNITDVDLSFRSYVLADTVKTVTTAIQQRQTLRIYYHSKSRTEYWCIAPNQLVYASRRYHVRAYCYDKNRYIDIVLSRILEAIPADEDWVSLEEDNDWQTFITLYFKPNPALPEQVKKTLVMDFHLQNGIYSIPTRKALQGYVLREMERVDWFNKIPLWLQHY